MDASEFQLIAPTVACEQLVARPAAPEERTCPGWLPVDVPPTELRVGDQLLAGGRLVAITDLRYRHGGTRTMILAGGRLAVAERTVRVYRPRT
ncbi:hypothetical protein [Streptomyces sp. NPDC046161]|uniref:hypothetical protein n=1 Tax=Streptomyces sp. NPDC046161 TaxID=3155132 RepID=UPI00340EE8AC